MAAPALLARLIVAALRKWAPRAVGAALKVAGAVEIGELVHAAWRSLFGDERTHAEVLAGYQSDNEGEAPAELVEALRDIIEREREARELVQADTIEEEEILRQLDAAERIGQSSSSPLNVNVKVSTPRARRCNRR